MIRLLSAFYLLPAALSFTTPTHFQLKTITTSQSFTQLRSSAADVLPSIESSSNFNDNNDVNISAEQYTAHTNWVTSQQQAHLSPKFSIQPSQSGGYGAFVTADVPSGELLLSIPRCACLTLDDVYNDIDVGPSLLKLREQAGPGSDTVVMAGYLAKEYLVMKEYKSQWRRVQNGDLVDGGALKKLKGVKFAHYLESLPWKAGVNAQDHVLFWSEEDVEQLLVGSLAYDDAVEIRNSVRQCHDCC
jgi:hypothetical protein